LLNADTTALQQQHTQLEPNTVVNPRFPRQQMLDALNADLDDLSSTMNGLFRVVAQDISYNGSDRQVNLTSASNVY
jgi:hypothetical protein